MMDLIVFSVGSNRYALNIENIQRIIQAKELTNIPNSNPLIDGIMSYEGSVIKVLNFRKLIQLIPYDQELLKLFTHLKETHKQWVEALKDSIENGTPFTKMTNPNKCELGMWLNNFNSYDDSIVDVLQTLIANHKNLHTLGSDALNLYATDKEKAQSLLRIEINNAYNKTMKSLEIFISQLDKVASSLQKLVLYENNGINFAIKVDTIEDIAHVEESRIMNSDDEYSNSDYLELSGVLDINGVLINVIKTVNIPK